MGCDIHIAMEQLSTINGVEAWRNSDHFKLNHYYTPKNKDGELKYELVEVYRGRDYDLFAALADVRNRGFITPLAQPRGTPADADETTKTYTERYGCDGHSHSYCTLQELYDYQAKHGTKTQSGMLSPADAKALDDKGTLPSSWCQATSAKDWVKRTWTRLESPVDGMISAIQTRMSYWGVDEKIEQPQAERIRIVFFFDN